MDGDYEFCFDNSFSRMSEKVIFFELILDHMNEEGEEQEDWKNYVIGTDLLDMKLEDILVRTIPVIGRNRDVPLYPDPTWSY